MTRFEKEQVLINKFNQEISKRIAGYAKKVKTLVNAELDREYDLIILGKQPKVKKEKKSWNKVD